MAETVVVKDSSPAADEAQRAAASAQVASEAATAAIAMADVQAAKNTEAAAAAIAASQAELNEWRNSIKTNETRLSAVEQRSDESARLHSEAMAKLIDQVQSIQSRLDKPPDTVPSPSPSPPADDRPALEPEAPPERKRAHRWI